MINKYLFISDEHRQNILNYNPEKVEKTISNIEDTTIWITAFSTETNGKEDAYRLSKVHNEIKPYNPKTLYCGSSAYFNRRLYPLINEFERKLRGLVYLASSITDDDKATKIISSIEKMEFSVIFDMLFTDKAFVAKVKDFIGNEKKRFTRAAILEHLDKLVETTLWNVILNESAVPTLQNEYKNIQNYRNDVMHAHNISKATFENASTLFVTVNKELDSEISALLGYTEDQHDMVNPTMNQALADALAGIDYETISEIYNNMKASSYAAAERIVKICEAIQPSMDEIRLSSNKAFEQFAKSIDAIQPALETQKQIQAMSEALSLYGKITENAENIDENKTEDEK